MNRKTVEFTVDSTHYAIDNVPYHPEDEYGEATLDLGVAVKLEALAELMIDNQIEKRVDFSLFDNIRFDSSGWSE